MNCAASAIVTRRRALPPPPRGFTLVEVLVASLIALLVVLATIRFAIFLSRASRATLEMQDLNFQAAVVEDNLNLDFAVAGGSLAAVAPGALTAHSYADEIARDAPRGWWRFDEAGASSSVRDFSAAAGDGQYQGAWAASAGALANDADQAATAALGGAILPARGGDGDFTIEWWLLPQALADGDDQLATSGAPGFHFQIQRDGSLRCGTDPAFDFTAADLPPGSLAVGAWHQFVYTYNRAAGQATLYRDGQAAATRAQPPPTPFAQLTLANWQGGVDEVSFYPVALAADRVRAHYAAAATPPIPQLAYGSDLLLPAVAWRGTFETPPAAVAVDPDSGKLLLLGSDPDLAPTTATAAYTGGLLVVAPPTRGAFAPGDILWVADWETRRGVVVAVRAVAPVGAQVRLSVDTITTDNPAWGMVASPFGLTPTNPGATVCRLLAPVIYQPMGNRLVRQVGAAHQTLALGLNFWQATRSSAAGTAAPVSVTYELQGEADAASSAPTANQRLRHTLTLAPTGQNRTRALS